MNRHQLSERLQAVSRHVPRGAKLADIGSDHAYLPVYLLEHGVIERAIAGEINDGPLLSAMENIQANGFTDHIQVKKGSGLAVLLNETDIDTVTIAGMGGPLITAILNDGQEHLSTIKRLILQPNVAADRIRQWLYSEGWDLISEEILEEEGHIYEILVAEPGTGTAAYSNVESEFKKELWLGPILIQEKHSAFQKKWKWEYEQLKRIEESLNEAKDKNTVSERLADVDQKITWLKEVFHYE
ncbi:tRNA (adenine(22)-N(1))-methyltransferase [Salisediminibacterium beveridgei]|uniref:tRNA (Adenine-N(1)-)-methyltransferase TrmK n=1 Tax=Salisediminibacterium beveridgei TaxID=632773 RepID=A0A1D7QUA9_9BACI|nr:tRNA (adenine(22)-N(1))-methyltransferase TrmK [Salisediminibacterium beveridgei]AOM82604.1 tRNA (adenine-N(1)-)-methyltransferase TrmK [Salisediminibacterium beveridgei]